MARLRCDFFSDALALNTSMTVILPQPTDNQIGASGVVQGAPPPVLYLLHGLTDDDTIWVRRTSVERYADARGLAVIMPQVHRSFYADEVYGAAYWTFLTEELPALVARFFRVTGDPGRTYVAGFSMGGYGALRWVLTHPDRFGAAASLSGAVLLNALRTHRERPEDPRMFERIFGAGEVPAEADLVELLNATDPAALPPLYLSCGTEDALYADNRALVAEAERRGVALTTSFPPGDHDWDVWDAEIARVVRWLPISP